MKIRQLAAAAVREESVTRVATTSPQGAERLGGPLAVRSGVKAGAMPYADCIR